VAKQHRRPNQTLELTQYLFQPLETYTPHNFTVLGGWSCVLLGNHPDFRIAGKIFASLGVPDRSWGMVKLTPEQQRAFMVKAPDVFKPCSGAWGRQGYTNVYLASAKPGIVRAAVGAAAKNVGSKKKKRLTLNAQ
jgi:hypothetical protein